MFCVVVGDIVKSREISSEDRKKSNADLKTILNKINNAHRLEIFAPFDLVRGDAIEGILYSIQFALPIIWKINQFMLENSHVCIRFCAVSGQLSCVSTDVDEADGPAFHAAMKELDRMKKSGSDDWFQISLQIKTEAQPLLDSTMALMGVLANGWTDKQRNLIREMLDNTGTQNDLSKKLKVAPSVISKQLRASRYDAFKNALESLEYYLNEVERSHMTSLEHSCTSYYSMALRNFRTNAITEAPELLIKAMKRASKELEGNSNALVPFYKSFAEISIEQLENNCKKRIKNEKTGLCHVINDESQEELASLKKKANEAIQMASICQQYPKTGQMDYALLLLLRARLAKVDGNVEKTMDFFGKAYKYSVKALGIDHPFSSEVKNRFLEWEGQMREEKSQQQLQENTLPIKWGLEETPGNFIRNVQSMILEEQGEWNVDW